MSAQAKGSGCTFWRSFMIGCDVPCIDCLEGTSVQSCSSGSRWIHEMPVSVRMFAISIWMQVLWAVLLRKFDSELKVEQILQKSFIAALDSGPQLVLPQGVLTSAGAWIRQNLQLEVFPSNVAWPEMSTDLCPANRALSLCHPLSIIWYLYILILDTVIPWYHSWWHHFSQAARRFSSCEPPWCSSWVSTIQFPCYAMLTPSISMQFQIQSQGFMKNISWMLWKFADLAAWYLRHLF